MTEPYAPGMGSGSGAGTTVGTAILLVALGSLSGCSSANPEESSAPASASSDGGSSSTPESGPTEPTRPPSRYQPHPSEIDGAAKRVAARAVEALPDVGRVTYTQYFGYLPPDASILVEADFEDGGGTTYDVRISQTPTGWRRGTR